MRAMECSQWIGTTVGVKALTDAKTQVRLKQIKLLLPRSLSDAKRFCFVHVIG